MKRCLACQMLYSYDRMSCPSCGEEPERIGGITVFCPEMARQGDGFRPEYFAKLAALEDANFWFRARNSLITWALGKYAPTAQNMLEIGCGTGVVLAAIASARPDLRLTASELFIEGLELAQARVSGAHFMQLDARDIPFRDEFDIVGAFDVVEHVKEDSRVVSEAFAALRSNGLLILTVPQHPSLWSHADIHACHERRYTARELHEKVQNAGFSIVRSTSFVVTLLPAMAAARTVQSRQSRQDYDPLAELRLAGWLNGALHAALTLEVRLIRAGTVFPVGGTRFLVARKP